MAPSGVFRADTPEAMAPPSAADLDFAAKESQLHPLPGPASFTSGAPTAADTSSVATLPALTPKAPTDLSVFRDTTVPTSAATSVVQEPSTDQSGKNVFATGNWHAEYSRDNGTSWTSLNPFTVFGSGMCCDQVTVYDAGHNRQYWLLQYDNHLTIANSAGGDFTNWCAYSVSPATFGRPTSEAFDYNDLAVGTEFLYLTSNTFNGSTFAATGLMRLSLDDMAACRGASVDSLFRSDLFTLKVAQGIKDVAVAFSNNLDTGTGTTIRILSWPENSMVVSTVNKPISTFVYMSNGTGNCASQDGVVNNWCQRTDSRALGAARGNGNLWFSWNARQSPPDRPFPYTRITQVRESDLSVLGEMDMVGSEFAVLYPSLSPDNRGHLGLVGSWGGGTGSDHFFPGGFIGVIDDIGSTFNTFLSGAGGGCLNTDGLRRWGDYNTARGWYTGEGVWTATTFARPDNTDVSCAVVPMTIKNVVFGRERDRADYDRFSGV